MKLTAILLTVACISAAAKSVSQITISEKNTSLEKVLVQIQKQTGYQFVYTVDVIQKAKPVAASEIMPWLKPEKYSIIMISEENLELLKTKKDIGSYRKFLAEAYPDLGF